MFIIKQEGNSFAFVAAKNYGRKMLPVVWNRCLVTLVPQHCGKLSIPVPILRNNTRFFYIFY
ncbi:MAG TPA: hypothetical protein VHQ93_11725, partial [Chitinophagaceae bacterium]|nr:hypothetical protein [Chitinophagaceae bacterium]